MRVVWHCALHPSVAFVFSTCVTVSLSVFYKRTKTLAKRAGGNAGHCWRSLVAASGAASESTMLSSPASDGQVTLEAHHASARKILIAVQQQLDLLETGRDTSIEIQSEISQRLNTLSREVQTIEELLPYAASDKRKVWGRRVQQLKADQRAQSALARSSPAATRHCRRTPACSGLLSEPTRRSLAARVATRGCGGAPLPA